MGATIRPSWSGITRATSIGASTRPIDLPLVYDLRQSS